jgi:hypothetical protein
MWLASRADEACAYQFADTLSGHRSVVGYDRQIALLLSHELIDQALCGVALMQIKGVRRSILLTTRLAHRTVFLMNRIGFLPAIHSEPASVF